MILQKMPQINKIGNKYLFPITVTLLLFGALCTIGWRTVEVPPEASEEWVVPPEEADPTEELAAWSIIEERDDNLPCVISDINKAQT